MPEPDLLSSLQPPTIQSIMAPMDTLGQVGVGLSGIGREQNPALLEAQGSFRQQVELLRLQQSAQRQKLEKSKVELELGKDFLNIPEGRPYGAKIISNAMSQMGTLPQGMSPTALEMLLSKQPLDDQTLKGVAQDFELFPQDSDVMIAQRRGVDPKQVTDLRAGWKNKTTRRLLFPKLAEFEIKEREFEELRADRQAQLAQRWLQFKETLDLRRDLAEAGLEMRRTMLGFQRDKIVEKDLSKRRDTLTSITALGGINQKLIRAVQKMAANGALPDRPGLFSDVASRIARHTTLKNDPDVMFFLSFGTEQGIGLARTYQKDVAVRSVQPFQAMLHTMMNPGPLQTMLPILQQWQTELDIAKQAALTPAGFVGPQEVQELQDYYEKLNVLNSRGISVQGFQEIK